MNKQSGITLIEALIAMLILSIGVLALISLVTSAVVASHRADQHALMRVIATDIQERAWIHSNPGDSCNNSVAIANLNSWSSHPLINEPSTPPMSLSVRNDGGCILTITPQGNTAAMEFQVTGPGGAS